jgi:cobalt-zinc-cadmium efflux system membrane fusion protein
LAKERPKFIKDLFLEAKIWLNDQTVNALPEKAIVLDGESSYVYVANDASTKSELEFEALRVIAGTTDDGFTSVKLIDPLPEGMKIVTKGAYYVYAQSKAGELAHEH